MTNHINIVRVKVVHDALEELKESVVFVGGATVSLYADRETFEVRPTDDVDILIELYSRGEFIALEEKLRKKGFVNDTESKFVGRYKIQGVIVDVMPTLVEILGFSNRWYSDGYTNAVNYRIDEGVSVKIFTAPYFIATKLEAFKTRGKNAEGELEGRFSQDFEDIVFVLENRSTIFEEMENTEPDLRKYLKQEWINLMANPYLEEWIDGYAGYGSPSATYIILDRLRTFIGKSDSSFI